MTTVSKKFTRRHFLRHALLPATALLTTPLTALASNPQRRSRTFPLYFTEITGLGPEVSTDTILERFTPLHPELALPAPQISAPQRRDIKMALESAFRQENVPWQDDYQVSFVYQHYGVPHQSRELSELIQYSDAATCYLESQFSRLFTPRITWQLLPESGELVTQNNFTGYAGRFTYHLVKAFVNNAPDAANPPYLVHARPIERAINYIKSGTTLTPDSGMIFLVPGVSAMVAPFSEFIHLTFHKSAELQIANLAPEMGMDQARQYAHNVTESLVESLSYSIARLFILEIGHEEKLPTLQYMADNLATKFSYMPLINQMIDTLGVQQVIDIALDNPKDFIERFHRG